MESKHNYDMVKMSVEQEIRNLQSQLASATATKAARRPAASSSASPVSFSRESVTASVVRGKTVR